MLHAIPDILDDKIDWEDGKLIARVELNEEEQKAFEEFAEIVDNDSYFN